MSNNGYIIITGATSDMGVALAKQLIDPSKGPVYNLILIDINKEKLLNVVEELSGTNPKCSIICLDIDFSYISNVYQVFSDFLERNYITNIYGMVHIAGIAKIQPLKTTEISDWLKIININLLSAVEIVRVLSRRQYKKYVKSIVFISSVYAHFGGKANILYTVSKAAIEAFVVGAAVELAPIRVNAIAPGGVNTRTMAMFSEEYIKNFSNKHLLGTGTAENVADILFFLLSDKASWITGQTYIIDGGLSVNAFDL